MRHPLPPSHAALRLATFLRIFVENLLYLSASVSFLKMSEITEVMVCAKALSDVTAILYLVG